MMEGVKIISLVGFIVALTSIQGAPSQSDDIWVLLVAGSNGYYNYRHQADVSHAYQIMIQKGVPADKIVVMMYDDVAGDSSNPKPGTLINKPNGPDVYKGVKIDYRTNDVTVKNFINVLKGDKDAMKGIGTGRVIESTSESKVFVNFVDHGGAGILCFPSEDLTADVMENTLRSLAKEKKFKKLLLYIEACEAGSVFDNIIEENLNIMVSTASARDESSWGCYCDDGTCLGDLYSVSWMEHMDSIKEGVFETVFHQYQAVRTLVDKSHVQLYGDYSLGFDQIGSVSPHSMKSLNKTFGLTVSSRDIPLHVARMNHVNAVGSSKKHFENKLNNIQKGREIADEIITKIMEVVTKGDKALKEELEDKRHPLNKEIFPCYKELLAKFKEDCFNYNTNTYFLQHLYKFANLCITGTNTEKVLSNMARVCNERNVDLQGDLIV